MWRRSGAARGTIDPSMEASAMEAAALKPIANPHDRVKGADVRVIDLTLAR
jgi:hypothetical protein